MKNNNSSKDAKNSKGALREKSFQLAIRIVRLCKYLREEKKEFTISKQLLRAGTNPGAMVRESANAETGLDFVHKLGVGQKEAGETQYWLELLYATEYLSEQEFQSINADTEEVMKMLRSSILTKKRNMATQASAGIILFVLLSLSL